MIVIGADHAGLDLKNEIKAHLEERGIECVDFGTDSPESTDYPDYARKVARAVSDGEAEYGVLICGTGIGMSMAANKVAGVRAALGDIVLIHDGARPFPTKTLIHSVLAEAARAKAAIPALPITDLLHHLEPRSTITTLPSLDIRLGRAQTPQGFHRDLILRCLEAAPPEIRDDASAILLAGKAVATVPGERTNIKITQPEDLPLAEAIAALREP